MDSLLKQYKAKDPEIIFEWNDSETDAQGWIVINSLRNGAAGGGTRMRKGLTKDEVVSLAKVMEIKFSVCGPDIGGAKSGINFDPTDPRREEVLRRWYQVAFPLLKNYYGTGGDLNVDELKDVIPITEELGLWHPQEGIVNGHLGVSKGSKVNIIGQLRYGCAKVVEDTHYGPDEKKYAIADLITGYGVAEAVRHYYQIFKGTDVNDKRVIVQGWGNVASAAGIYLAYHGAKVVGIIDKHLGVIEDEGLSFDTVNQLFLEKSGNKLNTQKGLSFAETDERIWDLESDIFIPGAASKLVSADHISRMREGGLEVISCGANVPFVDDGIFFGPTALQTDQQLGLIPDFIANCGMARVFAYLMQPEAQMTDEAIFQDVSTTIRRALEGVYSKNQSGKGVASTALELALQKLMGN